MYFAVETPSINVLFGGDFVNGLPLFIEPGEDVWAEGYGIYRAVADAQGNPGKFSLVAMVPKDDSALFTLYVDTGLAPDTRYCYQAKAYAYGTDGTEVWGKASDIAYGNIYSVPVPQNVIANPVSNTAIKIQWSPVPGATAYEVTREHTDARGKLVTTKIGTVPHLEGYSQFSITDTKAAANVTILKMEPGI